MDFSRSNARLTFQKSMDELIIIPTLHRPTLSFLGMPSREKVVASRLINDRFIVLDNTNTLNTWDAMTGQLLASHKYTKKDYTGYVIHDFASPLPEQFIVEVPKAKRTIAFRRGFSSLEEDEDEEEEEHSEHEHEIVDEDEEEEEEEPEKPKEPIPRNDKPTR